MPAQCHCPFVTVILLIPPHPPVELMVQFQLTKGNLLPVTLKHTRWLVITGSGTLLAMGSSDISVVHHCDEWHHCGSPLRWVASLWCIAAMSDIIAVHHCDDLPFNAAQSSSSKKRVLNLYDIEDLRCHITHPILTSNSCGFEVSIKGNHCVAYND